MFQKLIHLVGSLPAHLRRHMPICIQCESSGIMSQVFLNRLDVTAGLQRQYGIRVPLRYNNDKPEKPRNFKGLEVYQADFSSFSNPKNQATKPLFRRGC